VGCQYPEITRAKVRFDGREYLAEPFEETEWKLASDIVIGGRRRGAVDVFYLERPEEADEALFLKEEHYLLEGIAYALSEAIERKLAEESLRTSEAKYRSLVDDVLDTSAAGVFILDADFKVVWINRTMERYFGLKREEIVGKDKRQLIRSRIRTIFADPETFAEKVLATYDNNTYVEHFECRVLPDGDREERWLEHRSTPIRLGVLAGGRIEHYYDITQRKRAENAVRESKERFRTVVTASKDAMISMDQEGLIVMFNPAAEQMFGRAASGMLGRPLDCLMPEEYRRRHRRYVEGFFSQGEPCGAIGRTVELPAVRSNGEEFPTELSLSAGERGGRRFVLAVIRDVTERKRAEEELQAERNKLHATMAAVQGGITIQDREYNIIYQNKFLENRLGGIGEKCYRVYERREEICEGCPVEKAFRDAKSHTAERKIVMPNGEIAYWNNTASPIRDTTGKVVACVELATVITEQKRAEEELVAAKLAAEAANRAKTEFLANMSHEIRTPMTAILGFTDLLTSFDFSPSERREHLETIHRNGQNLLAIINDILDLSKIEAEKIETEPMDCSPQEVVEEVLSLMEYRVTERGLTLDLRYVYPLPITIHTDPIRLRQILVNLLGNAIKFTDTGGVTITVRCTHAEGEPPRMQFEVADTGIGMTSEAMGKLFQPFTQADGSTTRRYGGTGLGLSIAQRMAKLLGGRIDVQSEPGAGSIFTLTIDPGPLDGVPMLESASDVFAPKASEEEPTQKWIGPAELAAGSPGSLENGPCPADMAELLDAFAEELPQRAEKIKNAFQNCDLDSLEELSHQLKGSAAVYGFPAISATAGEVYQCSTEEDDGEQLQRAVDELIHLCRNAQGEKTEPNHDSLPPANLCTIVKTWSDTNQE